MNQVDRNARLPLYHQLYKVLHERILPRQWRPGDRLPTEAELAESYGVSRITVRKVLDMLVKEGLIYRQAGRGTFIAHATLEQGLSHIISFTEDMQRRGFAVSTRVLSSRLIPAPDYVAQKLHIRVGEELAQLERLRLADGEPMCIENAHFVHRYCRGTLARDFSVHSLREIKIEKFGIRWTRARQTIRPSAPRRRWRACRTSGRRVPCRSSSGSPFRKTTSRSNSCRLTIRPTVISSTVSCREEQGRRRRTDGG